MIVRPARRRTAAVAVEAAVVLPPLLMLLLGLMEFCRYQMLRHIVESGAREGARFVAVGSQCRSPAEIEQKVLSHFAAQRLDGLTVRAYRADAAGNEAGGYAMAADGAAIAVRVQGRFRPMLPSLGLFPESIPLSACSVVRNEVRPRTPH